jgi:hypothetical protein
MCQEVRAGTQLANNDMHSKMRINLHHERNTMKKTLAVLCVLALVLFAFGCKKETNENNTTSETTGTAMTDTAATTGSSETSAMPSGTSTDTSGTMTTQTNMTSTTGTTQTTTSGTTGTSTMGSTTGTATTTHT